MQEEACDLAVLGSGAAGLAAALTGALRGLRVVVLEHAPRVGGTSARSSGTVWVPDSPWLRGMGVQDDRPRAERYLAGLVGDPSPAALWRTFLDAGPEMLAELRDAAGVRFRPFMTAPDYRQDIDGAAPGGRALEPEPFDGRRLGADFARLDPPLPEFMLFGGMMVTRAESAVLLRADRSLPAAALGLRLCARYLADRARGHVRGTRLVLGNALVARLWHAARERGAQVRTGCRPVALLRDGDRVAGVDVEGPRGAHRLRATRGVVLAGGGFPASPEWRARHLPAPVSAHTPAAPGCDGSTITLGLSQGAVLGPAGRDNALWFPSSFATRADGSTAIWPHIVLDRAKPGLIAVGPSGRRFVDEAVSYHEFVRAMYGNDPAPAAIPAWLVCDRAFIGRYGLGLVRPRTPRRLIARHVRDGYLRCEPSIAALAVAIGVPPDTLTDTIARFNAGARVGRDDDFYKGGNAYDRAAGDPAVGPNPCLAPLEHPPFYALAVYPTPLGTSLGLRTDGQARVLDAGGRAIPGLYACGNDMHSPFGGEYPGAGGQLGPALTFGWLAARHAAAQPFPACAGAPASRGALQPIDE